MKNDEWLTPKWILEPLGRFDLDPCAPAVQPWATAARTFTKSDDGLAQPWAGRVWLNPPFGRHAITWLRKLAIHGDGIALVPARTETRMFNEVVWPLSHGILFLNRRPHFHYVDGTRASANSGAPICLIGFGQANADVLKTCGLGQFFSLRVDPAHNPL